MAGYSLQKHRENCITLVYYLLSRSIFWGCPFLRWGQGARGGEEEGACQKIHLQRPGWECPEITFLPFETLFCAFTLNYLSDHANFLIGYMLPSEGIKKTRNNGFGWMTVHPGQPPWCRWKWISIRLVNCVLIPFNKCLSFVIHIFKMDTEN